MASRARNYDQRKLLGQVYTPRHIVDKILLHTDFYTNFSEKKILDPACGDGRFLVPIAEHIIANSAPDKLDFNLKQIHGWDIDPDALAVCRQNLDQLISGSDLKVDWNLQNKDALRQSGSRKKFDLIIGNPPYIRVQHLSESQRKHIQSRYLFCKTGSTDAYVAFFELASSLLSKKGVCGFITPNSYFTSSTGKALREFFLLNQNLIHITNYGTLRLFENTGTYSAITVFGKTKNDQFVFEKYQSDFQSETRQIPFSELDQHKSWQLAVKEPEHQSGIRLGDQCQIAVGITTLADRLYLFSDIKEEQSTISAKNKNGAQIRLEKELLKPIVKGSKLKSSADPIKEYILFPYKKDASGKHRIIPEQEMKTNFPMAYQYFLDIKNELAKRDNGKPNAVAWYAFGRAQALDLSFGKKIIFSPISLAPNFILYENPDSTVYSGYFIKYDGDYEALLRELNSSRMADYIETAGRDFQGGYKGYNKKILENFTINN
jgi:methylase of polypeptide subunit release factors